MSFDRYNDSHTPIDPVAGRPKLPKSAFPSLQVFEEAWSLNGYKTMSFLEDGGSEFWLACSDIRISSLSKAPFCDFSSICQGSRKPALIAKLFRFFDICALRAYKVPIRKDGTCMLELEQVSNVNRGQLAIAVGAGMFLIT